MAWVKEYPENGHYWVAFYVALWKTRQEPLDLGVVEFVEGCPDCKIAVDDLIWDVPLVPPSFPEKENP